MSQVQQLTDGYAFRRNWCVVQTASLDRLIVVAAVSIKTSPLFPGSFAGINFRMGRTIWRYKERTSGIQSTVLSAVLSL